MPGFDRTGPWGEGPRSGWGMGRCGPAGGSGFRGRGGFGFRGRGGFGARGGSGFGRGRGWRGRGSWGRAGRFGRFDPPYADDRRALEEEADSLRRELKSIEQRLSELKASE